MRKLKQQPLCGQHNYPRGQFPASHAQPGHSQLSGNAECFLTDQCLRSQWKLPRLRDLGITYDGGAWGVWASPGDRILADVRKERKLFPSIQVASVSQFSGSVMSDSLRPHRLQHARPTCPSPTPRACSNSCPSSW